MRVKRFHLLLNNVQGLLMQHSRQLKSSSSHIIKLYCMIDDLGMPTRPLAIWWPTFGGFTPSTTSPGRSSCTTTPSSSGDQTSCQDHRQGRRHRQDRPSHRRAHRALPGWLKDPGIKTELVSRNDEFHIHQDQPFIKSISTMRLQMKLVNISLWPSKAPESRLYPIK